MAGGVNVTGGERLKAFMENAKQAATRGERTLDIGFIRSTYPDGTPIAAVMAWNEFGTRRKDGSVHVPERPTIRPAVDVMREDFPRMIERYAHGKGHITDAALNLLGQHGANLIAEQITELDEPANAPATIKAKGVDNPMIQSGTARRAASWEVK